ncbi:MAG: hypothetical protein ACK42F_09880, partial [Sphingobacteriales bacterium]
MLNRKSLPVLLVVAAIGLFMTFSCQGLDNPTKYERIFKQVAEMLEDGHYSPHKIDDNFSK